MKNREIKFRAWDKITKKIYYVSSLYFDKEFNIYNIDLMDRQNKLLECLTRTLNEIELIQYTGLQDKNNKPIYEGDILEWGIIPCGSNTDGPYIGSPVVVEYTKNFFGFRCYGADKHYKNKSSKHIIKRSNHIWGWELPDNKISYFKIIGNIYEHKNLLEVENG